jgi:hypothetical protein
MAYTQKAGRGNASKTGNGLPSALLQKKPDFKGSTDKGEMGGGYLPGRTANTDLLKVAKHYGGKVVEKIKEGGRYLSDLAEGKKGSAGYSGGDESMRQKNIGRKIKK